MFSHGTSLTVTGGSVALVNNYDVILYITSDSWVPAGEVGVLAPGNAVVFSADFMFDVTEIDPNAQAPSEPTLAIGGMYTPVESVYNRSAPGSDIAISPNGTGSYMIPGGEFKDSPGYSASSIVGSRTVGAEGEVIANDGSAPVTIQIDSEQIILTAGQCIALESGVVFTVLS
jgi:hypothetical protein